MNKYKMILIILVILAILVFLFTFLSQGYQTPSGEFTRVVPKTDGFFGKF